MNISSVSPTTQAMPSYSTPNTSNDNIAELEKQKTTLKSELQKVNSSKGDEKTKQQEVKEIQAQIEQINAEIQQNQAENAKQSAGAYNQISNVKSSITEMKTNSNEKNKGSVDNYGVGNIIDVMA